MSSYSPELPEPIIHLIQSSLTSKEAAQATLLSKSWRAAWSTRPTLDLDESQFPGNYVDLKVDGLPEFATKTFRRYEESNLTIHTFGLRLKSEWYGRSRLPKKWTSKALKMGATNLTFRFYDTFRAIPLDDVFGSKNVGRTIDRLKLITSITLSYVRIKSDSLSKVISGCPLMENLSLSHISPDCYIGRGEGEGGIISLHKLKSLLLCEVGTQVETLLLDGLSSKFPSLKDLTLEAHEEIMKTISNPSLEILNIRKSTKRVEFDVPRISKFTYAGLCNPNMVFRSTSGDQCDSHVSVVCDGEPSTTWFYELSKFLTQLRGSKIHLRLHVVNKKSFDYPVGEIKCSNACEVEDVTLDTECLPSLSFMALLDGLFRICLPKTITQYLGSPPANNHVGGNTRNNDLVLCQALDQGMKVKTMLPSQFMYGLRDLEEVYAQNILYGVWRPLPLDSILDGSTSDEQRRIRFQLKWKPHVVA